MFSIIRTTSRLLLPRALRQLLWNALCALAAWGHAQVELFWCATQGIRWRRGWRLMGKPSFRIRGEGARIIIGERFSAHSISNGNAIGVVQSVLLTAWGAGAILEIGDDVGMSGCSILATQRIAIGNRVMIGSGALILDTDAHPLDPVARMNGGSPKCAPVFIEDDVFIGARVIIMKGVKIRRGAVVGAGAVVTADVPPYCIVAGNPARVVGTIPQSESQSLPQVP